MFRPPEMVGHLMVQTEIMEFQFVFQLLQLLLPFVGFALLLLVQMAYEDIPTVVTFLFAY